MPLVQCKNCGDEEIQPFERIHHSVDNQVHKPYRCPDCVDYAEVFGYHELRQIVSLQGESCGSNPKTVDLIEALKSAKKQSV